MNKNFQKTIEYSGLTYKTEISKLVLINVLGALGVFAVYYFTKDFKLSGGVLLLTLLIDFLIISNYSERKKKIDEERENEFVRVISYFEIFLSNRNNVYQSFNKVVSYCSEWMKESILKFLRNIDEDKTVKPYIDFAKLFKNNITTNIMLSIYSMVDQGESFEQINHFQVLFEQFQKSNRLELQEKKKRSLSILASMPLVGAGMLTIVLTISVISIIGDLINVI